MKIALVNDQYYAGGVEAVVRQLHRGLREAGHRSQLHVAWGKTYPKNDCIAPLYPRLLSRLDHSRFHDLVESMAPRALWTDRAFRKLASSSAQLVHIHHFHGDFASVESLAHVAHRKPVVWTFHNLWGITGGCIDPHSCRRYDDACGDCPSLGQWPLGNEDDTPASLAEKRQLLSGAPLTVVAPSSLAAEKIQTSQMGCAWRVVRIPTGIDPQQFGFERKHDPEFRKALGLDPDATIVLLVSHNFKDLGAAFEVMKETLAATDPQGLQIVVAGRSSIFAINRLPEEFSSVDCGYVEDRERMALLFEAADIFLFASADGNFPCSILEAMAAKCCVVATPTSGVGEQIQHRKSGFLAFRFSGPSLTEALAEALAHPEMRMNCGENARRRIEEEFSKDVMVSRHIELYQSLLADV